MESLQISYPEKPFHRPLLKISKEFLEELEKGTSSPSFLDRIRRIKREQENETAYSIPLGDFYDLFSYFFRTSDRSLDNGMLSQETIPSFPKEAFLQAKEEYLNWCEKIDFEDLTLEDYLEEETLQSIEHFIKTALQVQKTSEALYRFRDTLIVLERAFDSFEYFPSKPDLTPYQERVVTCQKKGDLEGLVQIARELQKIIVQHWSTFTTDISQFEPGKPFRFLGHSTSTVHFEGDFETKYVSTSLFTEELTDTYRSGFGFLVEPSHIVGASSRDMYVKNGAETREELGMVTTEMPLDGPEKIIAECKKQKEENRINHSSEKVYSEVVVEGFHPIAIFCFTNGSKEWNYCYRQAQELKKQFPHLPIVEIDLTRYHQQDWEKDCQDLVTAIEAAVHGEEREQNIEFCRKLTRFWQEFQNMKKRPDYTKEEILESYEKNKKLIVSHIPIEELLKEYNQETIKYVLNHNFHYDIATLLTKKKTMREIEDFYFQLSKGNDKNTLNLLIPGLGTFMELYPVLSWTEELFTKMNEKPFSSMEEMVQFLYQQLDIQKKRTESELEEAQASSELARKEYEEKTLSLKRRKEDAALVDQEYYYRMASSEIEEYEEEQGKLEIKQEEETSQITSLREKKTFKEQEKRELEKRKLFHRSKIRQLEMEITALEGEILFHQENLERIVERISSTHQHLSQCYQDFQTHVGVSFSSFLTEVESAKKRLAGVDIFTEEMRLPQYQERAQRLATKVQELQAKIGNFVKIGGMTDDISVHIEHRTR